MMKRWADESDWDDEARRGARWAFVETVSGGKSGLMEKGRLTEPTETKANDSEWAVAGLRAIHRLL